MIVGFADVHVRSDHTAGHRADIRIGLHFVAVGQRHCVARVDAHCACRGLRYDHAVVVQAYRALRVGSTIRVRFSRIGHLGPVFTRLVVRFSRIGQRRRRGRRSGLPAEQRLRTIHPTGTHRLQRDHLAELAAFTVGHGNQLNAFAPRIAGQITRFNAHVHARRDATIRSDFLPHRISVIIVRDHHQIVLIHVLILFRAQCGNGVVDRKSAHNQRGAAGHAADRHDQTRFEAENVARRDFAEEAHAIPQRLDTLQQNARSCTRRFRTHETGRLLPHFLRARIHGCSKHADHEQRDSGRSVQPVVFQAYVRHHIQASQYDKQERWNAKEAYNQAESTADQAGEQREQQVS